MNRYLMSLPIYAAFVVFLNYTLVTPLPDAPVTLLDHPVPSFELPTLEDPADTFGSDDISGQVSLLNVWASWCPGCRQEHPYLVELSSSGPIPIYGLNYADKRDDALAVLSRMGDPYITSGFDEEGEVAHSWGVHGLPKTFLISDQGRVLHAHTSALTPEVWERDFLPRISQASMQQDVEHHHQHVEHQHQQQDVHQYQQHNVHHQEHADHHQQDAGHHQH